MRKNGNFILREVDGIVMYGLFKAWRRFRRGVAASVSPAVFLGSALLVFILAAAGWCGELVLSPFSGTSGKGFDEVYVVDGDTLSPAERVTGPIPEGLASFRGEGERLVLTVFHFNDLHHHITVPHKTRGNTHFLAQMVRQVREARAAKGADEAVLFLSAGDDHTGTPFDELLGGNGAEFTVDPVYRAYSAANLDAAVIGNHDLDKGTEILAKGIAQDVRFPVLSANLHGSAVLRPGQIHRALLGVVRGYRVGIVGLTTTNSPKQPEDPGFRITPPLEALQHLLPALEPLCDVVILLTHVGYEDEPAIYGDESDRFLARKARELTSKPVLVVGAHSHSVLNEKGLEVREGDVPILQGGQRGQFLGKSRLDLVRSGDTMHLANAEAFLVPLKKRDDRVAADNPDYGRFEHDGDYDEVFEKSTVDPLFALLSEKMSETLGAVTVDGLDADRTLVERYTGECALANFMNEAIVRRAVTFSEKPVDLALINASGVIAGVDKGSLAYSDWYAVMPFADTLQVGEMTGAQIRDMVVNNAKRIIRPDEAAGMDLKNTYVGRGFLHFSGALRYTIRLGRDAGETVAENITLHGKPIEEQLDRVFTVVFNSYIGNGGGDSCWNGKKIPDIAAEVTGFDIGSLPKIDTGLIYRNEIIADIRTQGGIDAAKGAALDGRVTLVP